MSGQYPYQYGQQDQSTYSHVGGGVLPGLTSGGSSIQGMQNMSGIQGAGGMQAGMQNTGSPLSQAGTLVPMPTPSPGTYSATSQSPMGHSTQMNNQISQMNAVGGLVGYAPGNPAAQSAPGPPSRYGWPFWIPAEGISRQVINEQVCKNLGNDALVRQRLGTGENEGVEGYAIDAYRNFTPAMIEDLKRLTKEREREIQRDTDRRERQRDRVRGEKEPEWDRDASGKRTKRSRQESPQYDPRTNRGSGNTGNTPPVQPGVYPVPGQDPYRQQQQHSVAQHAGYPNQTGGFQTADPYGQYANQAGYGQYAQQVPGQGQYMTQGQVPQHAGYQQYPNTNGVGIPQTMYANQQTYPPGYGAPAAPTYNPHSQSSGGVQASVPAPNYYYGQQDGSMYPQR